MGYDLHNMTGPKSVGVRVVYLNAALVFLFASVSFAKDAGKVRIPANVKAMELFAGDEKVGFAEIMKAIESVGKCGDEKKGGASARIVCMNSEKSGPGNGACIIYEAKDCPK